MHKLFISRENLNHRHRLSHQQIDRLLGEKLAPQHLQEKLAGLKRVQLFLQVVDLLNLHNIDFISIKGPLLSQFIYGDPTVRLSHDIDILVNSSNIEKVNRIMLENGFSISEDLRFPENSKHQRFFLDSIHHISYIHKTEQFFVEIHWVILMESPIPHKKIKEIIDRNTSMQLFKGRSLKTFSPEFNLLFLIMHGSKHGWQRLKWLIDIKDYSFTDFDKIRFSELVHQFKAEKVIAITGYVLKEYLDTEHQVICCNQISSYAKKFINNNLRSDITAQKSVMEAFRDHRYRFMLYRGAYYKLRVINNLFSSPFLFEKINFSNRLFYYLYKPYNTIKNRFFHA